jgi:hypothetical protein
MFKSKLFLNLLLALALFAGPVAARGSAATPPTHASIALCPTISSQLLKAILTKALEEWTVPHNYTYGLFRSSYNHGSLLVSAHDTIQFAYNVKYDGITVCVTVPA